MMMMMMIIYTTVRLLDSIARIDRLRSKSGGSISGESVTELKCTTCLNAGLQQIHNHWSWVVSRRVSNFIELSFRVRVRVIGNSTEV